MILVYLPFFFFTNLESVGIELKNLKKYRRPQLTFESFCNAFYIQNIYGCKSDGLFKIDCTSPVEKPEIENDQ